MDEIDGNATLAHCGVTPRLYDEVEYAIRKCVAKTLGIDIQGVATDVALVNLGADSLQFQALVAELQLLFNVELETKLSLPDTHTVATYAVAVMGRLSVRANE